MKIRYRWTLGLLLGVGVLLVYPYRHQLSAQALSEWVEGLGLLGPLAFVALYALGTLLFLPGALLTLTGGAVFGLWTGTLYNLAGATLGAGLSFLSARYLLGPWVEAKVSGRLAQLKTGVEREDWRFVAFVRLVPLFPFNLLNYALGLTRIGFWRYLGVSFLTMAPGATVYTYLGVVGKEAMAGEGGLAHWAPQGLLALGLLVLVAYLPRLYFLYRSKKGTPPSTPLPASLTPLIPLEEFRNRFQLGQALLLDLRETKDFLAGHITDATSLPLDQLQAAKNDLLPWKQRPVFLVCTTSVRSQKAFAQLSLAGFEQLAILEGGMKGWVEAGFPTQDETKTP